MPKIVRRNGQIMTLLAIFQTLTPCRFFLPGVLESMLARQRFTADFGDTVVYLMPKDILAFEFGTV